MHIRTFQILLIDENHYKAYDKDVIDICQKRGSIPRPKKFRRVCCVPMSDDFSPHILHSNEIIRMSIDEYETIRLIDLEGLMQEQCAQSMNIARTSVVAIYASARQKLADALVNGKRLIIEGGDIEIASQHNGSVSHCRRHRHLPERKEIL